MFTKNFNKYITTYFIPENSWIEEGNRVPFILKMAQLNFDLLELYARKLRKQLYESKGALSTTNFFQQINDELHAEMIKRKAEMEASIINSESKLEEQHEVIKKEISELADYCKECKPAKKKK